MTYCKRACQWLVKDSHTFKNFSTRGIHYFNTLPRVSPVCWCKKCCSFTQHFRTGQLRNLPLVKLCIAEIEKFLKVGESLTNPWLALCKCARHNQCVLVRLHIWLTDPQQIYKTSIGRETRMGLYWSSQPKWFWYTSWSATFHLRCIQEKVILR